MVKKKGVGTSESDTRAAVNPENPAVRRITGSLKRHAETQRVIGELTTKLNDLGDDPDAAKAFFKEALNSVCAGGLSSRACSYASMVAKTRGDDYKARSRALISSARVFSESTVNVLNAMLPVAKGEKAEA